LCETYSKFLDSWQLTRGSVVRVHQEQQNLKNYVSKEIGSFSGVAKLYSVSDKAICKWFAHYGLPTKKQELKKYLEI